jgi:L-seryl-tRNA(Ser) seleniumtransferase
VDALLRDGRTEMLIERHGRSVVTEAIRAVLARIRVEIASQHAVATDETLLDRVALEVQALVTPSLRPVFNLTGTILHTNLGRAPLPTEAIDAVVAAAREPSNVEFDLDTGKRGDRDDHVEAALCRLTGAAAATVVNNNAAAVLLVLNTLAARKEVPTSRGELIEIGGSFRMPDIMKRAGCTLREIGTTNRVHLRDYADAIGPKTGLVMKVHTSNYEVVGFTSSVPEPELSSLCRERGVPFVVDLGSGMLVDLAQYGLPHEPTPSEALAHGADIVTFSGDKLLGGPQAGVIVGRADLVAAIKRNPLRRALRVDKMTIAALSAVLAIYADTERLAERLPVIKLLRRDLTAIRALADRLLAPVTTAIGRVATVRVTACESQIGSGALPTRTIPSAGLAIEPLARRGAGRTLSEIASAFRRLPTPVVGRVQDDAFVLDLRCLDDEARFAAQLTDLRIRE